jgi:two-component system, chemotaxis family, CheB/CheR fusion protein
MGLRFLVADDNQDTADSLAILLKHEGFDVRVAYDGRTAFDTAMSFHPDVFILDIRMPRIDGLQLAHRLRSVAEFHGKLFIAHSGYSEQDQLDQASRAHFDEYLIKPFSWQTLMTIVSEATDRLGKSQT